MLKDFFAHVVGVRAHAYYLSSVLIKGRGSPNSPDDKSSLSASGLHVWKESCRRASRLVCNVHTPTAFKPSLSAAAELPQLKHTCSCCPFSTFLQLPSVEVVFPIILARFFCVRSQLSTALPCHTSKFLPFHSSE
jgi:hypothetical protein